MNPSILSDTPPMADDANTPPAIPSLQEILGPDAAALLEGVDVGRADTTQPPPPAAAPAPAPAPAPVAAKPPTPQPAPTLSAEHIAAAVASAVKSAVAPAQPQNQQQPAQQNTKFDPLAAIPPETRETFQEFINSGLRPVVDNLVQHFEQRTLEYQQQIEALKNQLSRVDSVYRDVKSTGRTILDTTLRTMHPDWEEIRTSPEWENLMNQADPLTGLTNNQVLQWRLDNDGPAGAAQAYSALINQFRASRQQVPRQPTLSTLATPRPAAVSTVPAAKPSVQEEIQLTQAAIEKLRSKAAKTPDDLDKLNRLYDRLRALSYQSAQAV